MAGRIGTFTWAGAFIMGGVLNKLGLTDAEETIYIALLSRPGGSASELARGCSLPVSTARAAIASLCAAGLAAATPGRVKRFIASPAELALQSLLLRQQQDLEEAKAAAGQFIEQLRRDTVPTSPIELVEVLSDAKVATQRALQLVQGAQKEVLSLSTPPYSTTSDDVDEPERLKHGVRFRVIVSTSGMGAPGNLARMERDAKAGEETRWLPELPLKLLIIDRKFGLVPILGPRAVSAAIQLRASPLLDALVALFEALWGRATPLRLADGAGEGVPRDRDRKILTLVASGLKDDAIASQLGIAPRTVRRHISQLMDELSARTRIQMCLEAARREWL